MSNLPPISFEPVDFTPIMEKYSGQGAFRFWCQTVLPLVYDDSLSYYELLNKVVVYLNKTIEDVGKAESNIDNLNTSFGLLQNEYNLKTFEAINRVNILLTEFTALKNYVDNYFDNLDLQTEIETILDGWVQSGEFNDLLYPVVRPIVQADVATEVSNWLTQNVDPVGSAVVVDSTLSVTGAAADAKVTGDRIADVASTANDAFTLTSLNATNIPADSDLNTYVTPGNYKVGTVAIASSILNGPTGNDPYRLIVMTTSQTGRVMQIALLNSNAESSKIMLRFGVDGTWQDWKSIAQTELVQQVTDALKENIISDIPTRGGSWLKWTFGQTITSTGNFSGYVRHAYSEDFPVLPGQIIKRLTPTYDTENYRLVLYIACYHDGTFIRRSPIINADSTYTIPSEATSARFVYGYHSNDAARAMTAKELMKYFSVQFWGKPIPGDGQTPVYVAIGASTTIGAVHHFTGQSVTYSTLAYPEYIGEILGLKTHNLGQGTTGFLARDAGDKPNFMDSIYNNSSVLEEADLITIGFGYGNDRANGLEFGEWDDYFPYDELGYFFVEGETENNAAGITSMLNSGATLMGCLNWCIKYLGEHYPKATLVCIWGAPSANDTYAVTVENNNAENAGSLGVSPKKIVSEKTDVPSALNVAINTLKNKLNIPIINLMEEGIPFSYYAGRAKNADGTYAIFSTKGTSSNPVWNSHPNEDGYLIYARFLAGKISEYFKH